MHVVIMAWLFVIGTMALTWPSVLGGLAFFTAVGVAPVAFYAWVKLRRLRAARRDGRSVLQQRVHGGDDADTGRDHH